MGYTQIYYLAASLPTYIKYLHTKKIDIGFYLDISPYFTISQSF